MRGPRQHEVVEPADRLTIQTYSTFRDLHQLMAATLDTIVADIQQIQRDAQLGLAGMTGLTGEKGNQPLDGILLLGAGLMLMLYYALYLVPLYPLGIVGALFIGIGLHVLVPLGRQLDYDQSRDLGQLLGSVVVGELPKIATLTRNPDHARAYARIKSVDPGLVTAGLIRFLLGRDIDGGLVHARSLSSGDPRRSIALMTAAFGLGQMIGPSFAGFAYEASGSFTLPTLVAAATLVVAFALTMEWRRG